MAIDLAKLVVSMEANSAQFTREMEKVNGRLDRFEKRTGNAIRGINRAFSTLGASLAATGLVAFLKTSANVVSEQRAMAESVGLTTSAFSALNYAARQNSLSQEELGKSLGKLNILLGEAANGEDKAEDALKKFGITSEMVRSGAVSTDEALRRIADRFASMPNGIEKTALAAQVFGERVGPRMVQFLNLGSKGLDEFARQGELVGAVITDKVADAVAKANDKLSAFYQTLQTQVLVGLSAFFGLVEANEGDKKLEELTQQISGLEAEMALLVETSKMADDGGVLGALFHTDDAARIAEVRNELAALNRERDKLKQRQLDELMQPASPAPRIDTSGSKALEKEAEAARKAQLALEEYGREWHARVSEMRDMETWDFPEEEVSVFMEQAARNIQSFTASLVDAAMAGEDMGDAITGALRRIAAEMITASILQGVGLAFPGLKLPGRAAGGPVSGGMPYVVGEEGPELFVPRKSGTIVPNDAMGGGGVSVELNVDNRGATGEAAAMFARSVPALAAQIEQRIAEGLSRGRYRVASA